MREQLVSKGSSSIKVIQGNDFPSLTQVLFDHLDISPNTRYDYEQRTPLFLEFMAKHPLSINSYLEYKRYLSSRVDYSVATKAKYLTVAKVILKELCRQGYLPTDITSTIKGFGQSKKHKTDGINQEEMTRLIMATKVLPDNTKNSRVRAILSLLTFQGLRQVEISRLDVSDLDLLSGTAMVRGKGNDDKEVIYLHPETVKSLNIYLKKSKIKSSALFVSQSNSTRNYRLTTRSIRSLVQAILVSQGIHKTTHGFRHYFTTTLIKKYKGDLLEVAGYTRHKSLEMLQVYNDTVKQKADLPRYYSAFDGVGFST